MLQAPPLKYGKLQCSGSGFTFASYTRESPATIRAALGIDGTLSRRRDWWEAQVRLYGVPCSTWTIEGMKMALKMQLKKGELCVSHELNRMAQVYNDKYHSDNKAIENRASNPQPLTRLSREEARTAVNDQTRLFWEVRMLGAVIGVPGLGWRERKRIHRAAERQGLYTKTISGDLLLVARNSQELMRETKKDAEEAAARARVLEEERKAREIARKAEIDRMHQETVESGNEDIAGTWILEMRIYRIRGYAELSMQFAVPDDGTIWATYNILHKGVLQMEWNGPNQAGNKSFEWTKTSGVDTFDFDYDNHKGTGTITFISPYTCEGMWDSHEFTGRKVSNEVTAMREQCKADFDKATEEIMAMDEKWKDIIESGYSKKQRWKILMGLESDSDESSDS